MDRTRADFGFNGGPHRCIYKMGSLLLGPSEIMTTQIYRTTVFYSCVHVSDINNLMMIINIILIERDLAR